MDESRHEPLIRVGVIGLGTRGMFHLERWADGSAVQVVAAADPTAVARADAAALCRQVTDDVQVVLERPDVDVVLLAVPNAARFELGRRALAAGKQLAFAGPPIAATHAEATALFRDAEEAGTCILVSAPWREDPDFCAALAVARSGVAGRLLFVRFERWESGATDASRTHRALASVLDQLVALADRPARRVYASQHVGGWHIAVHFEGDLDAALTLRTDGAVRVNAGWAFDGEQGGFARGHRWVRTAEGEVYEVAAEAPPAVTIEDELRRVLAGGSPVVTRRDSLRLVTLLAAVERSSRSGAIEAVEDAS